MADAKLFYVRTGPLGFNFVDKHHIFAAFASRVALELTENEAATRLAVEAVSHHMRMVVSVVGDKMETAAPSEPALALAAAVALNENQEGYRKALAYLLNELILKGVILDRGAQGELCTRLLFILARDRAAMAVHNGQFMDASLTHVLPITLADLLETLIGPNYGCHDKSSKRVAVEVRKLCQGLTVHWTHFHVLKKPLDEIPIALLEWAFFTGAALQCAHNQENLDLILPTYSGPLGEKYRSDYLGAAGVQAKAQTGAQSAKVGASLTMPPITFEHEGRKSTRQKANTRHPHGPRHRLQLHSQQWAQGSIDMPFSHNPIRQPKFDEETKRGGLERILRYRVRRRTRTAKLFPKHPRSECRDISRHRGLRGGVSQALRPYLIHFSACSV